MSVLTTDQVYCASCNALNSAEHPYCGVCRADLVVALGPGSKAARRRLRDGPRVLAVSGGMFLVSAMVALGALIVMQIGGWSVFFTGPLQSKIGLSGGGDPPWFVGALFVAAFTAAGVSLFVLAIASCKHCLRAARDADYAEHRRAAAAAAVVTRRAAAEAADVTRRGAIAVRIRGRREYAEVKPKVAEVAKNTRERFEDDVAPHLAAGAEKAADAAVKGAADARRAAVRGRAWLAKRRDRSRRGA